jgi:copper resistance protein D
LFGPVQIVRLLTYAALALPSGLSLMAVLQPGTPARWRVQVASYLAIALLAATQLFLIASQGDVSGLIERLDASLALATEAWIGKILLVRFTLALATSAMLAHIGEGSPRAGLAMAVLNALLLPLSGHGATAEPYFLSGLLHSAHVTAAIFWAGGLLCLGAELASGNPQSRLPAFRERLRAFSPVALWLVVIAVASGVPAAALETGRPAALIGTAYGQQLLLKSLVFLPIALAAAGWLRFRYLRAATAGPPLPALAVEIVAVVAMCVLAAIVSQGIPGRHDGIVWPLGFRLDVPRLWTDRQYWPASLALLAMAGAALVLAGYLLIRRDPARALFCAGGAAVIPLFGLIQVAVPATPASFADSTSRYAASNLANAAGLFQEYCVTCHGTDGRGDGPAVGQRKLPNADLTAAHTKDHLAGDLYWWIGHGTPSLLMPGFGTRIDADGRWDLVNYVRYLSASRETVALGTVVEPNMPSLPSIDADFLDHDGVARSLGDFEPKSPVLLVIGRETASLDRLKVLRGKQAALTQAGLVVIFVCSQEISDSCQEDTRLSSFKVLRTNVDDMVWAWTGYRRTKRDPDDRYSEKSIGHLEFLIDRFGYVRARWRADEGALASVDEIIGQARILDGEPELMPFPEQHAH